MTYRQHLIELNLFHNEDRLNEICSFLSAIIEHESHILTGSRTCSFPSASQTV